MIYINRKEIKQKFESYPYDIDEFQRAQLTESVLDGDCKQALRFLIKNKQFYFPYQTLAMELEEAYRKELINPNTYINLVSLLKNASNGNYRILMFLRNKGLIKVEQIGEVMNG